MINCIYSLFASCLRKRSAVKKSDDYLHAQTSSEISIEITIDIKPAPSNSCSNEIKELADLYYKIITSTPDSTTYFASVCSFIETYNNTVPVEKQKNFAAKLLPIEGTKITLEAALKDAETRFERIPEENRFSEISLTLV